jgi:hypothetical protein
VVLEDSDGLMSDELPRGLSTGLVVRYAVDHETDGLEQLAFQIVRRDVAELRLNALNSLTDSADLSFDGDHVTGVRRCVHYPDGALTEGSGE